MSLNDYKNISQDVWIWFKNFYHDDPDWEEFWSEVDRLDAKYRDKKDEYEFFQSLANVFFEPIRLKGVKRA